MTSTVEGIVGGGITLELTNSAGNLQELQGLKTCTPPNLTSSVVDTTDQKSNNVDNFIVARLNPGEMAGVIKYVPGNADDVLLREHWASRQKRPARLVNPSDGTAQAISCVVAVTNYTRNDGATDGERTATFTIKLNDLPTEGDAA